MTQVSPEVKNFFREDTLPKNTIESTTSDVIILGEDLAGQDEQPLDLPRPFDRKFIGPRDASDVSRGYLMQRAHNLAEVAVMNFGVYEDERARFVKETRASVFDGTLRLNTDYSQMPVPEQIDHFVANSIKLFVKPKSDVERALAAERVQQNLGSKGPERELQLEVNNLKDSVEKQAKRIFKVREMLVERGAGEEFMRKFDYTTKLMTRPELEAYEEEMNLDPEHSETPPLVDTAQLNLFGMFRSVLTPSFSLRAILSIRPAAARTGQIAATKQKELK